METFFSKALRSFFLFVVASALAVGALEWGSFANAEAGVGETIVVLRDDVDTDTIAGVHEQAFGFTARHLYRDAIRGYSAQLSANQVGAISRLPEVQYVVRSHASGSPRPSALTAAEFPQILTNGIRRIGGDVSSTISGDNKGIVDIAVAVVDGGIQPDHPDLNVVGGVNCVDDGQPDEWGDLDGHGTMVAGLIAALDNDVGIVGVAPGARLFAVRVANPAGFITDGDLLCAVDWIAGARRDGRTDNDIAVVNMSLVGRYGRDLDCGRVRRDPIHTAVCALNELGATTVVAAGNESSTISNAGPANYPAVLTVAAIGDSDGMSGGAGPDNRCFKQQRDDRAAFFSNFATDTIDQAHIIAAPGVCLTSTYIGGLYAYNSGTSFASPIVAGTVALCIASGKCPPASPVTTIATVLSDAAAYNRDNPSYGFQGDPLRQSGNKNYGYLIYAGLY